MSRLRRSQAFCSRFQIDEMVFMKSKLVFSFSLCLISPLKSVANVIGLLRQLLFSSYIDRCDKFFLLLSNMENSPCKDFYDCIDGSHKLISLMIC